MKVLGVLGLLLIAAFMLLIDKQKLKATANRAKCSIVYCAVLVAVILLGTLEIFKLLPTFNGVLINLFGKYLTK
jgi:O-antigen ligase